MENKLTESLPTRMRILRAARQCFAENGFHSTSMKTICKASDMSPGTLYHHFPSKEALIEAITHFREPLEGVGLVDYLVESTIAVTREDCAQRALVVEIMAEGMRNPQVAEMLTNKYHTIIASLVARFNDAQAKGEIGADVDKEMAARLLLATTYGVLSDSSSAENARHVSFATTLRTMLTGLLKCNSAS
ncbi:TetR/AcrR family transcriptional regulator [Salmonella enterica]|uniref:TetR/AcrR family transcriptional regulator n=1 Tax=Salmonella enterica TaxID=28901 RepID=UPI001429F72C|nr:TetR/AcrR family transcriptional regulator [Salmonella enterica subsp. enterica serovar Minnesota]MDX8630179.1 TetR/AcrR family transcriptional regulator [Salmonella enterica]EBH9686765.1 TetR/AcrR family transcriptional regulator [Salmonella enterica subsp. enterica serovar Minnesota]EBH9843197.1 TetR/AcrR family transcriptional regulator [Salmonella enterica subsp. enterica serovar Minnesota]EBZ8606286.1 TetR/AcrR family transcriptional regulator [Salmonella enterica subsp. enterica serova